MKPIRLAAFLPFLVLPALSLAQSATPTVNPSALNSPIPTTTTQNSIHHPITSNQFTLMVFLQVESMNMCLDIMKSEQKTNKLVKEAQEKYLEMLKADEVENPITIASTQNSSSTGNNYQAAIQTINLLQTIIEKRLSNEKTLKSDDSNTFKKALGLIAQYRPLLDQRFELQKQMEAAHQKGDEVTFDQLSRKSDDLSLKIKNLLNATRDDIYRKAGVAEDSEYDP